MCHLIRSIEDFVKSVKDNAHTWGTNNSPWFRGEPCCETPLLPSLYRGEHDENQLVQFFRRKAPWLSYAIDRDKTSEWLFLMQHVRLPTRLLDWTEGALIALYFALIEQKEENKKKGEAAQNRRTPVVWMLDPIELNKLSGLRTSKVDEFPLEWFQPQCDNTNPANLSFRAAWERDREKSDQDKIAPELPIAVHPTNIHPRMAAQKSCFTVHGKREECLDKLLEEKGFKYLTKYVIDSAKLEDTLEDMLKDLKTLGISYSTVFPDLDGLAKDLETRF